MSATPSAAMSGPMSSRPSRSTAIIGWVIGVLPMLFLLFSAGMKFAKPKEFIEAFGKMGWGEHLAVPIGVVEAAAVLLYLFPRTAILGAILITGYMGGAISVHVRIGEPFIVQAVIGVVAWLGLYLREPRLRALIPFVRAGAHG